MNAKTLAAVLFAFVLCAGPFIAMADDPPQFPQSANFSTLIKTPLVIEGLTGDSAGNLYTVGRGGSPCPVWQIALAGPTLVVVGNVTAPCSPSGIAFNAAGELFMADGNNVLVLLPNAAAPPTATVYATGVPGANGLAFDRDGNLWTGDGTTGQGRVWRVGPGGGDCTPATLSNCVEVFRVPPLSNEVNLVAGVGGVGRDARTLPPGTITVTPTSRNAANTGGSQPLVANGVAFDREGNLYVADTARGAIWKAEFDHNGNLKSQTGCDTTFAPNTLCLDNIFVAHPFLEGTDGIALDRAGNIWNSANERNAIVVVTKDGRVAEVSRNTPNAVTLLRNTGPLEFPSSPFLLGKKFCTSNSDGNRRDNSPSTAGEIKPAGPDRGKISCMDQDLIIRGLPLPVH